MGLAAHLFGPNRAYLGTDTRVWELLLGGLGAMALRALESAGPVRHRGRWSAASVAGVVAVGVALAFGAGPPGWMWDGGLVGVAACTLVVVVGSVRHGEGVVARALAVAPLRWLGRISYSLYLWHWPVIVLITTQNTGLSGAALLSCRLTAMVGTAGLSSVLVEQPLRRADWSPHWRRALAPVAVVGVAAVVFLATVPPVEAAAARACASPHRRGWCGPRLASPSRPGGSISPADPVRAWTFGDSVMQDSAPGITAALEATGDVRVVANSSFGGWGLSTDKTWATDLPQIIRTWHPEIAVGTWSWDDELAQQNPDAYLAELVDALRTILTPGDGIDLVVLLQFPQVGPNPNLIDPVTEAADWKSANARQIIWNTIANEAVQFFPGRALYLPTTQLFAPGDRFFTWVRTASGSWIRARKLDNTHVCPYGAAQVGSLVDDDLTPVLGLAAMAPGWENGDWVHDANYDDPPGACPDDQPPPGYRGIPVPGPPS